MDRVDDSALNPPLTALREEFESLEGTELVRAARKKFGDRLAILSSFGADAAVTLSLVAQVDPSIHVLFLDTGKHSPMTLKYVAKLTEHFHLSNVTFIHPDPQVVQLNDPFGRRWFEDADGCCAVRKVEPLEKYVRENGVEALISGRRRKQTETRNDLDHVEWDAANHVFSINPIAAWTRDQVAAEQEKHPSHPLTQIIFPGNRRIRSVGCLPVAYPETLPEGQTPESYKPEPSCTTPIRDDQPDRAGRWAHTLEADGGQKQVCEIHGGDRGPKWRTVIDTSRAPIR